MSISQESFYLENPFPNAIETIMSERGSDSKRKHFPKALQSQMGEAAFQRDPK